MARLGRSQPTSVIIVRTRSSATASNVDGTFATNEAFAADATLVRPVAGTLTTDQALASALSLVRSTDGSFATTSDFASALNAIRSVDGSFGATASFAGSIDVVGAASPSPASYDFTDAAVAASQRIGGAVRFVRTAVTPGPSTQSVDGVFSSTVSFAAGIDISGSVQASPSVLDFTDRATVAARERYGAGSVFVMRVPTEVSAGVLSVDGARSLNLAYTATAAKTSPATGAFATTAAFNAGITKIRTVDGTFTTTQTYDSTATGGVAPTVYTVSATFGTNMVLASSDALVRSVSGAFTTNETYASADSLIRSLAGVFTTDLTHSSQNTLRAVVAGSFVTTATNTAAIRIVGASNTVSVWDGSTWVPAEVFAWNGTAWVPATASAWNGSVWS